MDLLHLISSNNDGQILSIDIDMYLYKYVDEDGSRYERSSLVHWYETKRGEKPVDKYNQSAWLSNRNNQKQNYISGFQVLYAYC